jgi:hypothetical protein
MKALGIVTALAALAMVVSACHHGGSGGGNPAVVPGTAQILIKGGTGTGAACSGAGADLGDI